MVAKTSNLKKIDLRKGGLDILFISPQKWDGFQVSKHHYALELGSLGHRVFFVNPPKDGGKRGSIEISDVAEDERIKVIDYTPWFPYRLKFHARWLFDWAMRRQARMIVSKCLVQPDVVWDFDNTYNFSSLKSFGAKLCIFHAVDQLAKGQSTSKDAHIVFSITKSIMQRIDTKNIPAHVIGHGLSPEFVQYSNIQMTQLKSFTRENNPLLRVGYIGNILSLAVDGVTIIHIVKQNLDVHFDFFGPYQTNDSEKKSPEWVRDLLKQENASLHGFCSKSEILRRAPEISAWLLCYDNKKDINNGADSHKVLEYLSTGAPIVSSNLDAYQNTNLLWMPSIKDNVDMPIIFERMKASLEEEGVAEKECRIQYALSRTYAKRQDEISELILDIQ